MGVGFRVWKSDIKGWEYCPYSVFLRRIRKVTPPVTKELVFARLEHDAAVALRTAAYDAAIERKEGLPRADLADLPCGYYDLPGKQPGALEAFIWERFLEKAADIKKRNLKDIRRLGIFQDEVLQHIAGFAWPSLKGAAEVAVHAAKIRPEPSCRMAYETERKLCTDDGKIGARADIVLYYDALPAVMEVRRGRQKRALYADEEVELAVTQLCASESLGHCEGVALVWADTQGCLEYDGSGKFGYVRKVADEIRELTYTSAVPKRKDCAGCVLYGQCDSRG
ncbi:MAG: hypothetical protein QXU82_02020 [Candidatus Aenigmatarchaeota archaeon]